jgi:hypothetical protein
VTLLTPVAAPVTVTLYVPGGVAAPIASSTVAVVVLPVVWRLRTVLVTPAGRFVTVIVGVPLNPLVPLTVTSNRAKVPCCGVPLVGSSVSAMLGTGSTPSSSGLCKTPSEATTRTNAPLRGMLSLFIEESPG